MTPVARKQRVELSLDCPGEARVYATEDDLYQILFNLVENGIKYNRETGSVSVSVSVLAETVLIAVQDTGVGIPEAEKPHIFERFYRVDKARSRMAGGAGLGLSIVSDMAARNQGSITVTDAPGGGTCFRISFPAGQTAEVSKQ